MKREEEKRRKINMRQENMKENGERGVTDEKVNEKEGKRAKRGKCEGK